MSQSIYDTRNNVALADGEQHSPGDLKEKLSKVREVVPSMSKDQICMALRSYDYDVNATITAISENGPEEALREWNCAGNKARSANRNKKRRKKGRKEHSSDSRPAGEGSNWDVIDELKKEGDSPKADDNSEEQSTTTVEECAVETTKQNGNESEREPVTSYGWGDEAFESPEEQEAPESGEVTFEESFGLEPKSRSKGYGNSCTKHSPDGKSAGSSNGTSTLPKKTCLEKSLKDLSRQTVALQRVQVLLEDELRKAEKALRCAFVEIQNLLSDRQAHLEEEMDKMKTDARDMLQRRQKLAADLKARSENASTLSESDLAELRDDIKHFVVERKYDEELGKTVRFIWIRDRIEREIKEFGQVVAVKDPYTCRRLSMSSCTSSNYPDSCSQMSSVSSTTSRNQYYSYESRDDDIAGRKAESNHHSSRYGRSSDIRPQDTHSSKVYVNSHQRGYSGSSLGARSSGFARGGRTRVRQDESRYGRGEWTGFGSGRPPHHLTSSRGRFQSDMAARWDDGSTSDTRRPSQERVSSRP